MQMNEKTMVADTLTGINGELVRFGEMIAQTEDKELKQTLKQFRNTCEKSQEELYQIINCKEPVYRGNTLRLAKNSIYREFK